jgi:hypothetical protein
MPPEIQSGAKILITLQMYVINARFAGFNTIHYLLKVWVFDLQSITNQ